MKQVVAQCSVASLFSVAAAQDKMFASDFSHCAKHILI